MYLKSVCCLFLILGLSACSVSSGSNKQMAKLYNRWLADQIVQPNTQQTVAQQAFAQSDGSFVIENGTSGAIVIPPSFQRAQYAKVKPAQ